MKRLCVIMTLFCMTMESVMAVSYRTELLKRIASYLPQEVSTGSDSVYVYNKYPCEILRRVDRDEVTHLGFQLFSWNARKDIPVLADFLERVMLDIYLQGSAKQMNSRLQELKIIWKENSRIPSNVHNSFITFLRINNKSNNFSLNYNNKEYTAVWKTNNTQYEMVFMASRELIYGTDMVEAEKIFYEELKNKKISLCKEKDLCLLSELTKVSETLYRKDGLVYQVQAKYTTDTYYIKISDSEAEAVYDKKFPQLSLMNMAEGVVPCGKRNLYLSCHRYGNVIDHVTVPFGFIYSALFEDMNKYFFVDVSDKDTYYLRVIYHNEPFQYLHVFEVAVPSADIFNDSATWKAHLYCFIPQNNLKEINIVL